MADRNGQIVVVGGGLGGLRSAESLRQGGYTGLLTLIGAEHHKPYDRPPLTKQVLRGELNDTTLHDALPTLDLDLRLGVRATGLDTEGKTITLDDGTEIAYDAAILAPGACARQLPGPVHRVGMHVVRTIDDALRLRAAIARAGAVVVIGGGFVGCEVAASARALGAEVDLVELLPAPLIRVLGAAGAAEVAALHEAHGVRLHLGTKVAAIVGDSGVDGVVLSDGTTLAASEVVVGLGVVPDVGWLDGSGVDLDDGIRCTAGGRTSADDVYAVGDAAQWWHPLAGAHRRVEHWTSTVDQARVVATNVLHPAANAVLADVPYFWSDQYDVKIQALGFFDPADDVTVFEPAEGRRVLLYSRDQKLSGAVGFKAARHVMRMRSLISDGASLADAVARVTADG